VSGPPSPGRLFGTVADSYDDVRPDYPDQVYDAIEAAIGSLDRLRVVDLAAGTGLQTRALVARGARVVVVEPDMSMVRRLRTTLPAVPVVAAVGEQVPLRDGVADLVVCATAWHWLRAAESIAEVRRVLRPGGHLALWWGLNAWGDNVEWEDRQSEVIDRWDRVRGSVPPTIAGVGPRDAARDLRERGATVVVEQECTWTREVTREHHLRMLATHSSNLVLPEPDRRALLAEIEQVLAPWPVVTERLWGPLVVARFATQRSS
jgi:SAM-dependent methyltransferase